MNLLAKWSPLAHRVLFTSLHRSTAGESDRDLYTANSEGGDLRQLTDYIGYDQGCAWSPKGDRVLFVSERDGNHELYVMTLASREIFRLTTELAAESEADWSSAR